MRENGNGFLDLYRSLKINRLALSVKGRAEIVHFECLVVGVQEGVGVNTWVGNHAGDLIGAFF